jgi:hypothetical protein
MLMLLNYVLQEDAEVKASSNLVSRVEQRKKANADQDASLVEKALTVASQVEIPAAVLVKQTARKDAQKVIKLAEDVQGLTVKETGEFFRAAMEAKRENVACSEENTSEAATSETAATTGKSLSYNTSDSITDLDSTSFSSSTYSDNIPLNRVYKTHIKLQPHHHLPKLLKSQMMLKLLNENQ